MGVRDLPGCSFGLEEGSNVGHCVAMNVCYVVKLMGVHIIRNCRGSCKNNRIINSFHNDEALGAQLKLNSALSVMPEFIRQPIKIKILPPHIVHLKYLLIDQQTHHHHDRIDPMSSVQLRRLD